MAETTSLAKAYVQILPSMEGFKGKLEEGLGGSGAAAGKSSGASFGDAFSAAAGVAIKASAAAITATAGALGTSIIKGTADIAEYGDNIDKMSQKMGLSAEAYQEWDAVMQHSGTSIESLQASMKTLASAAETGNKSFEALGFSAEQLQSMSQEDLFSETITALQNIEDTTQRTYLAGQLLGRGATELGALLNTSAEDTQKMKDTVHELGGVMSNEAVKAAAQYQDSLQDFQTALSGIKRDLTADFMPAFSDVMQGLTEIISGNADEGMEQLDKGIEELFGTLDKNFEKINELLPKAIEIGTKVIGQFVSGIIEKTPEILQAFTDIALQVGETFVTKIVDVLPQLYNTGKSIIGALFTAVSENLPEMLQVAMELVTALADDIGESLPQVLPQIASLIVDIAKTLTAPENLTPMLEAALGILKGLADGIVEALPTLVRAVPQIISNIMTILTEEMPKLLTMGQEVLTSLITGILDNLPLLVQVAFDLVDSLVTFVLDNLPQLLELAAQLILALVQGITENLPKIAEGAGELIPKIIATVVDKLPEIIDTGFEITVELVKGILKALPKIVESVVQLIGSMVIKFTEYDWLSLGKNLILGIKDGVVQYAYELINAVTDAGEKAYNAVKDFFGIASPSKLMRDGIGAYLPAGIAAGIMANEGDVTSAMNALADDVAGTTFGLPDIQGGNYSGANGGYGAYAAQPAIIQFVLPNGQVIAQWLEPDISAIQDRKIMIGQRGYAT